MTRNFSVDCAAIPSLQGSPALTLARLYGSESLSELFTYTLELKTPDDLNSANGPAANLDLKNCIGKECSVRMELEGKGPKGEGACQRQLNGIITSARCKQREGRHVVYAFTLRPWLWLATRSTDYKVFQEQSVVDILTTVLADYPFMLDKKLSADYPSLDFQVQYGESDFAFLQRLMQEWGIYWFFRHKDGKHTLVLCDHGGAHEPFDSSAYHTLIYAPDTSRRDEECIMAFEATENLTAGAWLTNDFDFTKPLADLTTTSRQPRPTDHAEAEVYEWPGDYVNPGQGDALARIRMEEQIVEGTRSYGEGNVRALVPGCTFTLAEHPQDEANQNYLVVKAELELEDVAQESGQQHYKHHVRFEVQPLSQPFRPLRTVPKPRTRGPQTATVTGPDGQEIWTDKYGRVKVHFHWDRYDQRDEKSSCWVRVSHPWAGSHFGAIHLPRIGQEVVVDFLNGDPDLPIITGRVYNAVNMPPWPLPDNATQSGILTRSSPEGAESNANALRFEDKKGEEEIWLHAEKDQRVEVENDEAHWVGNDRLKIIDNDEKVQVKHDRVALVDHDETLEVGNDQSLTVKHDQNISVRHNQDITITADRSKTVLKNETNLVALTQSCTVGVSKMENIGAQLGQNVGTNYTQNVGGNKSVTVGASLDVSAAKDLITACQQRKDSIGKTHGHEVGENHNVTVGKNMTLDVGEALSISCGQSSLSMDKQGNITLKGKALLFQSSQDQTIKAGGDILMKGSTIKEN